MVLRYGRFGPQVLAHELIGFEWYPWNACGHPDPRHIDDIWVVVYRDIGLEEVKRLYPVVKDLGKDYRYVHYGKALQYFDEMGYRLTPLCDIYKIIECGIDSAEWSKLMHERVAGFPVLFCHFHIKSHKTFFIFS